MRSGLGVKPGGSRMQLFRHTHRQKPLIVGGAQPSPLQTAAGTNIPALFLIPAAAEARWVGRCGFGLELELELTGVGSH